MNCCECDRDIATTQVIPWNKHTLAVGYAYGSLRQRLTSPYGDAALRLRYFDFAQYESVQAVWANCKIEGFDSAQPI